MKVLLRVGLLGGIGLFLSACSGAGKPGQIGLIDDHLRPCPSSPNCVSSMATDATQQIEPFLLQVTPEEAWAAAQKVLSARLRTQIISVTENYLHAECRSAAFGFIDDIELHLEAEQQQIAVRSAARLGYYDFGVNRKRIEELRRQLHADGVIRQ